jgi:hypothetical protein
MALKLDSTLPKFEITCTITRPTTSSSIAALVRTTPSLVLVRPVVPRIVNVVPKLVEHNAAPAANACKAVPSTILWRVNERAMGRQIPVTATAIDSKRFAFRARKEVDNPPVLSSVKRSNRNGVN